MRPCPFCGSDRLDVPSPDALYRDQTNYFLMVSCLECRAQGPWVEVIQRRDDGQPYARTSRMPTSVQGRERWERTIVAAVHLAMELWNKQRG